MPSELPTHAKASPAAANGAGAGSGTDTYKEVFNMAPFVMVVLSAHINNCRVLYANKPVTEKLGYEMDNLFGR